MKYICNLCKKEFEFNEPLSFCPYCGGSLTDKSSMVNVIDSIWGETASLKREFTSLVFKVVQSIKTAFGQKMNDIKASYFEENDIITYKDELAAISLCETRKSVLMQVEKLMNKLSLVVAKTPIECFEEKKVISPFIDGEEFQNYLDSVTELLGEKKLLGIENGKYESQVIYDRNKLEDFFNELQIAYAKYIRCVNDNNMFAAFPSNSDFGNVNYYKRYNPWHFLEDEEESVIEEDICEEVNYEEALKQLKEANALRYDGFLDEDFVPHVDAFWKGVFDILALIGVNNRVSLVLPKINIDEKFESKVRRKIASKEFLVTNEKIDRLQKLIEEIENSYDNR